MKTYSILVSLVLLLFINISFSQTLVNSFQKISATEGLFTGTLNDNDFFGRASTCIGDLDGDGVNDVAIGASGDDDGGTNKGAVWILFLNSDGTVKSHQKISDTQGGLTVSLGAGGVFGSDVDTVGDLNGDGVVDLAIGAQYDSDGGNWHGAIWILFMNPDGTVNNQQKISDTQGGFTANFGASCAFGSGIDPIGDFNGDNVPDLIVGMRRDNDGGTRRGAVFIICLNQNGTVNSYHKISDTQGNFTGILNNEDFFGCSVASLGDLDGDTIVDIAVGAFGDDDGGPDRGCVWVLFLNANGQVKSHQKISSTQGGFSGLLDNNDRFAHAMNPLGDFDDDGVNDLIVGAINDDDGGLNRGAAYLIYLNQNGTVKDLDKISDTQGGFNGILDDDDIFGQSVANIGDFNGGGTDDLIVGAALDDDGGLNKGAVYVLFMDSTIVSDSGNVLYFDGIDDYVDLGTSAGNGVRTIEMWFRPEIDVNPGMSEYMTLAARETSLTNYDEFALHLVHSGLPNPGTLRLFITENVVNHYSVYSDSNTWNAGQWYHVAAVIHPSQGMMLFIDGVKQTSTNSYSNATSNASDITTIGCQGNLFNRCFHGRIDDVRFSSDAIYTSDFTPPCPDLMADSSTIGMWNFNGSGLIAVDSSTNSYNGQLDGATRIYADVCDSTIASGNVLDFDGINDFVDLGPSAGNGVRTIELWFRPENDINNSITDYAALVTRNNGLSNEHEITLTFTPSLSNKGKLEFGIRNSMGNLYNVFSNSDSWNAGQWYHVAAVVHPAQGMMLFVDGIKQISTNSYNFATTNFSTITSLGCWGDTLVRLFCGSIDDVRFSSDAMYTSDFTPPCPDLMAGSSTIGMWNFNGSGLIAVDSSTNSYNGQLDGATRIYADVCDSTIASGNVLYFDGVDDYVDLGSDAGNGIRTIELWFKPTNQINNSITDYAGLVVRNNGVTTNENEFSLTFTPSPGNKGKLIFGIEDDFGNNYHIYSDSNSWNAGQWYHVAAVVHPTMGMMMFIDGVKQSDTSSYNSPTGTLNTPTSVGRWGNQALRHYHGRIDDVRFSSDAIYTTDFTPPCPDVILEPTTVGLWHFNEGSGTTAYDESSNGYNGIIDGAIYLIDTVCDDLSSQTISGVITYDNSVSTPLPNVKVYLLDSTNQIIDSTISSITGEYAFLNVPPGTYIINSSSSELWGGGNAADALAIMMHFVSIQPLYGLRLRAADCDISTYVNTMDALYVSQRFVFLIYSFPAGDWVFEQPAIIILGIAPVIQDYKGLCVGDVNGSFVP